MGQGRIGLDESQLAGRDMEISRNARKFESDVGVWKGGTRSDGGNLGGFEEVRRLSVYEKGRCVPGGARVCVTESREMRVGVAVTGTGNCRA